MNSDCIFLKREALSKDVCNMIIDRYERDNRRYPGVTGAGLNEKIKKTTDLLISNEEDWQDVDQILYDALNNALQEYCDVLLEKRFNVHHVLQEAFDTGFMIQKYNANEGFYDWHHDFLSMKDGQFRVFTYLWYLNDVTEGGETDFDYMKIQPEAGKLLIFPSCWCMKHRGCMPKSNSKYIITGWVFSNASR